MSSRPRGRARTIHVDEEGGEYGIAEIRRSRLDLRPDRIGHGILAAQDAKLMGQIAELVLKIGVDEPQLGEANRRGHEASFVRRGSA